MPDFPLNPAGSEYRPLKVLDPLERGWDVFGVQTMLNPLGANLSPDGVFGPKTKAAVETFQLARPSKVGAADGIAGIRTFTELVHTTIWPVQARYGTPAGLIRGQVEKESSNEPGQYPARYSDGTYDLGLPQLHVHKPSGPPTLEDRLLCFDGPKALDLLGRHLREYHDKYAAELDEDDLLAWQLAAGSWNAPAWADAEAAGQPLSQSQRDQLWAYIGRVTVYMT